MGTKYNPLNIKWGWFILFQTICVASGFFRKQTHVQDVYQRVGAFGDQHLGVGGVEVHKIGQRKKSGCNTGHTCSAHCTQKQASGTNGPSISALGPLQHMMPWQDVAMDDELWLP